MSERKIDLKKDLISGFEKIGLKKGDNVIVHTSLKSFGFVCGGPQIVIEALLETVGETGTIMMPTQTWKNLDPTAGVHWEEPKEWWDLIRQNWPAYDKNITPTNTMGAVAEMFRKWPGAVRSDHPARSLAALGPNAEYLVKDHDLSDIFGETSPLAKLYKLDGKVLLLGTGYDKNTSIHLADVRAEYPSKHYANESSAMMVNVYPLLRASSRKKFMSARCKRAPIPVYTGKPAPVILTPRSKSMRLYFFANSQ